MTRRISALLVLPFFLGCGPTLIFPGGSLSGSSASAPSDWAWTSEVSTVQLETRPADPYSVNIWAVAIGSDLYVHAGANRSSWVENMETDPSVRVRIDDSIYELAAIRVGSQPEFDAFSDAYEKKYGARPGNENVSEAYLFKLQSR